MLTEFAAGAQKFLNDFLIQLALLPIVLAAAVDIFLKEPGLSHFGRAALVVTSLLFGIAAYVPVTPAPYLINVMAIAVYISPVIFAFYWAQRRVFQIRALFERALEWIANGFRYGFSFDFIRDWFLFFEWPWEKARAARLRKRRHMIDPNHPELTVERAQLAAEDLAAAPSSDFADRGLLNRAAFYVAAWLEQKPDDLAVHNAIGRLGQSWGVSLGKLSAADFSYARSLLKPLYQSVLRSVDRTRGTPASVMLTNGSARVLKLLAEVSDDDWQNRQTQARKALLWRGFAILALFLFMPFTETLTISIVLDPDKTVFEALVLRPVLLAWKPLMLALLLGLIGRAYLHGTCLKPARFVMTALVLAFCLSYVFEVLVFAAMFAEPGQMVSTLPGLFSYLNYTQFAATPPFVGLGDNLAQATLETDSVLALPGLYFDVVLEELTRIIVWPLRRIGLSPALSACVVSLTETAVFLSLATRAARKNPVVLPK